MRVDIFTHKAIAYSPRLQEDLGGNFSCKGEASPHSPTLPPPQAGEVNIRTATVADVPLILSMIRELAEFEKLAHEVTATEAQLHKTLFGENPSAEVLLAYAGNAPAGFCLFFHNYSTFLAKPGVYIEDIFIRSAFRSQGIGMALFDEIKRLARARECGRIEWSVLDWNTKATQFYEKLGAQAMNEWTVYRLTEHQFNE